MRRLKFHLGACLVMTTLASTTYAQQPAPTPSPTPSPAAATTRSPWLFVPVFSSSPKLGTAGGGLVAYMRKFDPDSRVSLFGATYRYTTTHSQIAGAFSRLSFGADHHRLIALAGFGLIKNDYNDYLGTGQPLKTDDDLKAFAARYLFRFTGDWFIGAQTNAANYQVLGATPEDDLVLETLGIRGFKSTAVGAALMHDSRDNEDMPTTGWFLNVNNLAYLELAGGSQAFDAYRIDARAFWTHGKGHVLAVRQYNWLTHDAPAGAMATVTLRGYKLGQYLSTYMSSLEVEERLAFKKRWFANVFAGVAELYGHAPIPLDRSTFPMVGAGLQFVIKTEERMLVSFEYAQGTSDNRGAYVKLGYAW
jgi:hypothetical protein